MIYLTGDIHGEPARFKDKRSFAHLRKKDTLIVCGDFGFIWNNSKQEAAAIKALGKLKYTIAFIEGTHDNIDLIESFPLEDFGSAKAHRISKNVWHLVRGEVYEIDGKRILALGGGESTDFVQREPGVNWWAGEMLTPEQAKKCDEKLKTCGYKVDYIVTHQAPINIEIGLTGTDRELNYMMAFLAHLQKNCLFSAWYFGHYHMNRRIINNYYALYDSVILGEDQRKKRWFSKIKEIRRH